MGCSGVEGPGSASEAGIVWPESKADLAGLCAPDPAEGVTDEETVVGGAFDLNAYALAYVCDPARLVELEPAMLQLVEWLAAAELLRPSLTLLASEAIRREALPGVKPEMAPELANRLAQMIEAELCARGRLPGCEGREYVPWGELSRRHLALVEASLVQSAGPGSASRLTDATFVAELEGLSGSRFVDGNTAELLVDGPASFALRDELIRGAKKSIHLMSWAIYEDEIGEETIELLAEKHAQGVDVRVIVDGHVVNNAHHGGAHALVERGVPVVLWRAPRRPGDGQHQKLMVVDGQVALTGGMNVGDEYAHTGPAGTQRWRDTDMVVRGPAVADAHALFAATWNQQVDAWQLGLSRMAPSIDVPARAGGARIAVTAHVPGRDSHVQLATLKAIAGATSSIDIENAYFITTPDIEQALLAALERGVRVRILTNSSDSIDEPVIMGPLLGSLPPLVAAGAEVYLQRGENLLHSKFMTVDDEYAWVGSFNLHPRSHRYELENVFQILDADFAGVVRSAFEADIGRARRVESADEVQVPSSAFGTIIDRYFFDQL